MSTLNKHNFFNFSIRFFSFCFFSGWGHGESEKHTTVFSTPTHILRVSSYCPRPTVRAQRSLPSVSYIICFFPSLYSKMPKPTPLASPSNLLQGFPRLLRTSVYHQTQHFTDDWPESKELHLHIEVLFHDYRLVLLQNCCCHVSTLHSLFPSLKFLQVLFPHLKGVPHSFQGYINGLGPGGTGFHPSQEHIGGPVQREHLWITRMLLLDHLFRSTVSPSTRRFQVWNDNCGFPLVKPISSYCPKTWIRSIGNSKLCEY